MLIIFGLTTRTHPMTTITVVCERCGYQGAHQLTRHTRRISIFFVPLIPVGTRFDDTCTVCGRVRPISREFAEGATAAVGPLR